VDLCIQSPVHLHGLLLNWLSTGTILHGNNSAHSAFKNKVIDLCMHFNVETIYPG
jgi:hypothetical protein